MPNPEWSFRSPASEGRRVRCGADRRRRLRARVRRLGPHRACTAHSRYSSAAAAAAPQSGPQAPVTPTGCHPAGQSASVAGGVGGCAGPKQAPLEVRNAYGSPPHPSAAAGVAFALAFAAAATLAAAARRAASTAFACASPLRLPARLPCSLPRFRPAVTPAALPVCSEALIATARAWRSAALKPSRRDSGDGALLRPAA
jgi:hypothetical protein